MCPRTAGVQHAVQPEGRLVPICLRWGDSLASLCAIVPRCRRMNCNTKQGMATGGPIRQVFGSECPALRLRRLSLWKKASRHKQGVTRTCCKHPHFTRSAAFYWPPTLGHVIGLSCVGGRATCPLGDGGPRLLVGRECFSERWHLNRGDLNVLVHMYVTSSPHLLSRHVETFAISCRLPHLPDFLPMTLEFSGFLLSLHKAFYRNLCFTLTVSPALWFNRVPAIVILKRSPSVSIIKEHGVTPPVQAETEVNLEQKANRADCSVSGHSRVPSGQSQLCGCTRTCVCI